VLEALKSKWLKAGKPNLANRCVWLLYGE